jgi:predicted KAP-like P-loop ATPase
MISNDNPIDQPGQDPFGVDGFAQAIAKAIERLQGPEGTVLALTGPWGSGKSSVVFDESDGRRPGLIPS